MSRLEDLEDDIPPSEFPPEASKVKPIRPIQPVLPDKPSFPVIWLNDAELPDTAPPILKGLIDPGGFILIYGESGSGKSFFTADIALAVASGLDWRGRRTTQSTVVYVAAEAGTSILKRFVAARDHRLGEEHEHIPLAILTRGPNLIGGTGAADLLHQFKEIALVGSFPIGLVIFDTLSRSMHGGDENSAQDMTLVISAAEQIRDEYGAATIFVHHSGKDLTKGARGHSSLLAAADLVIAIGNSEGTVEKVRDGVAGEKFPFKLNPIVLKEDSDGDPVSTCLIEAVEFGKVSKRSLPSGKNQKIVLKEAKTLMIEIGVEMPETSVVPKGVKAIRFADLQERCSTKFPGLESRRINARITEAVASLQSTGHLGVQGDLLWIT